MTIKVATYPSSIRKPTLPDLCVWAPRKGWRYHDRNPEFLTKKGISLIYTCANFFLTHLACEIRLFDALRVFWLCRPRGGNSLLLETAEILGKLIKMTLHLGEITTFFVAGDIIEMLNASIENFAEII